jgi:2-polyprenyl-3-methyl-5-hydroxy-6-metoxy-1,4-benzoquinol methylase
VSDRTLFPQIEEDLETLSRAVHYRQWLYHQISGALGTRILEIGSGVGNYTEFLLRHGHVLATDVEGHYVSELRSRFRDEPNVRVDHLALEVWDDATLARLRAFAPDTVVCLNVLEHVPNDRLAVQNMLGCLVPGGYLALIVPALPSLFCEIDRRYGHVRRYTRRGLLSLLDAETSARVVRCRYFNAFGVAGWWVNHVLLERTQLSPGQVRFFDGILVPLVAAAERVVPPPFGLSLVAWIRKNG